MFVIFWVSNLWVSNFWMSNFCMSNQQILKNSLVKLWLKNLWMTNWISNFKLWMSIWKFQVFLNLSKLFKLSQRFQIESSIIKTVYCQAILHLPLANIFFFHFSPHILLQTPQKFPQTFPCHKTAPSRQNF